MFWFGKTWSNGKNTNGTGVTAQEAKQVLVHKEFLIWFCNSQYTYHETAGIIRVPFKVAADSLHLFQSTFKITALNKV